jgi:hypothetical protein
MDRAQIVYDGVVVIVDITLSDRERVRFIAPDDRELTWTRDHFSRAINEAWAATDAESQDQA